MKTGYKTVIAAALTACTFSTFAASDMPDGWLQAGSNTTDYEMGVDDRVSFDGSKSAYIKSTKANAEGFATMMQTANVEDYLGKRIKLSFNIKTEGVADWAGGWLRIDAKDSKKPLAFDNMYDRAITGTTDWKEYNIVLDVPGTAVQMAYGVLSMGGGHVWFDNLNFTEVDESTPVTAGKPTQKKKTPKNLSFEQE